MWEVVEVKVLGVDTSPEKNQPDMKTLGGVPWAKIKRNSCKRQQLIPYVNLYELKAINTKGRGVATYYSGIQGKNAEDLKLNTHPESAGRCLVTIFGLRGR